MLEKSPQRNKGFTLIELLVVIAIIGILASIVFVSVGSARQKAKQVAVFQNFRQIATAINMYYNTYGNWPSSAYDGEVPDFVPEFYPSWDAKYRCANCVYNWAIWDTGNNNYCGVMEIYEYETYNYGAYKFIVCDGCLEYCNFYGAW